MVLFYFEEITWDMNGSSNTYKQVTILTLKHFFETTFVRLVIQTKKIAHKKAIIGLFIELLKRNIVLLWW